MLDYWDRIVGRAVWVSVDNRDEILQRSPESVANDRLPSTRWTEKTVARERRGLSSWRLDARSAGCWPQTLEFFDAERRYFTCERGSKCGGRDSLSNMMRGVGFCCSFLLRLHTGARFCTLETRFCTPVARFCTPAARCWHTGCSLLHTCSSLLHTSCSLQRVSQRTPAWQCPP
eukprot:635887-Rhodomonas_salina.2